MLFSLQMVIGFSSKLYHRVPWQAHNKIRYSFQHHHHGPWVTSETARLIDLSLESTSPVIERTEVLPGTSCLQDCAPFEPLIYRSRVPGEAGSRAYETA